MKKTEDLFTTVQQATMMEITKLSPAHSRLPGIKSAVPSVYARDLGWEAGDLISWELDKDEKGKFLRLRLHEKGKPK